MVSGKEIKLLLYKKVARAEYRTFFSSFFSFSFFFLLFFSLSRPLYIPVYDTKDRQSQGFQVTEMKRYPAGQAFLFCFAVLERRTKLREQDRHSKTSIN